MNLRLQPLDAFLILCLVRGRVKDEVGDELPVLLDDVLVLLLDDADALLEQAAPAPQLAIQRRLGEISGEKPTGQ